MQWRVKDVADITIMLVCSAGMSTSLLVSKMQKSAESKGLKAEIFANSANEADKTLRSKEVDVLLLGPQVRFMKSQFEKQFKIINENFNETFKELFGGGKATLRLDDESKILER